MKRVETPGVSIEVDAYEDADELRPSVAPSRGLLVRREKLLRDLMVHGPEAGISVVCAPEGMGKTALLLEYVAETTSNPARGSARLMDASGMDSEQLYGALRRLPEELPGAMHPLVAVDNVPELGEAALEVLPGLLRELRAKGFEFILSCKPTARGLLEALGDSYKVGAQALIVRPREYPDWTQAFSIDHSLDVYALTQGVPLLVAALQTVDGVNACAEQLQREAFRFYEAILEDLRRAHDMLYRLVCLLLLVGEGEFAAFSRAGLRIREDAISRLARTYPAFGIDAEHKVFECMMPRASEMGSLRERIVQARPAFAAKALQVLMVSGRVDDAVRLADVMKDADAPQKLIAEWPVAFALSGNVRFVNQTVSRLSGEAAARASAGMLLAVHLASLVSGSYRTARSMAGELHRRAQELQQEVDSSALSEALALTGVWGSCVGVELPELLLRVGEREETAASRSLRRHCEIWDNLVCKDGLVADALLEGIPTRVDVEAVNVPDVLLICDGLLNEAFHGSVGDVLALDERMRSLAQRLRGRKLDPLAEFVRMTSAICRLMSGLPIVDERSFIDAGTAAVRASDLPMQLLCLLGEGWQDLAEGQVVNAQFRGQQVLRLADEGQTFLRSWAMLLERAAHIVNTSKMALSEEADVADLSHERVTPAEAWTTALLLSAAGYTSELSAWYSMHKATMLDAQFRPMACQAMRAVGERADAIRCMLPRTFGELCGLEVVPGYGPGSLVHVEDVAGFAERSGQVRITLFGGFRIERNGHVLTEAVWRRKRLCALASRLVLAQGSFVDRRTLTEEMWPDSDYAHARENLYTVLSMLRASLGQGSMGPQYVLTQGDGVALNGEYVASDVSRFNVLARDVLLKRTGTSGRQIIESCLKMEELYAGPLYVVEMGDSTFHARQRRLYAAKFVDCMLRGVETALALEDLPTASWLIEAAQRHAPYREDVMRQAMHIYDRSGRRREIVEMYNAHLYYLKHVVHAEPENETRLAYESIMGKNHLSMVM